MGTQVCERQISGQNAGRRILHHSGVRRQYAGTLQAAAAWRRQYAGTLQAAAAALCRQYPGALQAAAAASTPLRR